MAVVSYPISVSDIKRRLVGFDPWFRAAAKSEANYKDDHILNDVVPRVCALFSAESQMTVRQTQYVMAPDGTYDGAGGLDITGTMPCMAETMAPYLRAQSENYFNVRMNHRPLQTVQRMRIMLSPTFLVYTIPTSWLRWDYRSGDVEIVPVTGAAQISGLTIAFTLYELALQKRDYIPNSLAYDYIAGPPDQWWNPTSPNFQPDMAHVHRALSEYAALKVAEDLSELYDAGLMSKEIVSEGLNEHKEYDRFQRKREQLQASVDRALQSIQSQQKPVLLEVV